MSWVWTVIKWVGQVCWHVIKWAVMHPAAAIGIAAGVWVAARLAENAPWPDWLRYTFSGTLDWFAGLFLWSGIVGQIFGRTLVSATIVATQAAVSAFTQTQTIQPSQVFSPLYYLWPALK